MLEVHCSVCCACLVAAFIVCMTIPPRPLSPSVPFCIFFAQSVQFLENSVLDAANGVVDLAIPLTFGGGFVGG